MDEHERCWVDHFIQAGIQACEQQWCWVNTASLIQIMFGYHIWKLNDPLLYLPMLGHKNVEAKLEALASCKLHPGSCYLWAGHVKIGKNAEAGLKYWHLQMWNIVMLYWDKFTSAWGTAKPLLGLVAYIYCFFISCWNDLQHFLIYSHVQSLRLPPTLSTTCKRIKKKNLQNCQPLKFKGVKWNLKECSLILASKFFKCLQCISLPEPRFWYLSCLTIFRIYSKFFVLQP